LIIAAKYVSIDAFDNQYFEVYFDEDNPEEDADLSAPTKPYLLIQRQFEDDDGGVCYIETHQLDKYAGHFRLSLLEFTRNRLSFTIDRAEDRRVDVTFSLDEHRFNEVREIIAVIFGNYSE